MSIENGRPFNHYTCQTCGMVTITKHEDDGVTPFMLRCRANPHCDGTAYSNVYKGPQDESQQPHVIWFRPKGRRALLAALKLLPRQVRNDVREHFDKGGCLSREVNL